MSHAIQESPAFQFSLRSRFAWTFAGNAFYAASQWLVISLVAKLGSAEMLGQYALAVAIVAPVAMFAHLNLRSVVVTDLENRHGAGDYVGFRLWTTGLYLITVLFLALAAYREAELAAAILLIGIAQGAEAVSDLYYAFLQRHERMDVIAGSMILRGFLSAAALGLALWLTGTLVAAAAALALGRMAVLLLYDRPRGAAAAPPYRVRLQLHLDILRTALPLGIVLMLGALSANIPRYIIERFEGVRELGAFAAVASFVTVGSTAIHALGQAAVPRLARAANSRALIQFRRLGVGLGAAALLLGAAGALTAALIGGFVLRLLYRPEFAEYRNLLVMVMAAAGLQYAGTALGYVLTSARAFTAQIPLLALVSITVAAAGLLLVPRFGLSGAALAIAAAGCVHVAAAGYLVARLVRRLGHAA